MTRGVEGELAFVEGPPGQPLLRDARDINAVLEECFAVPTQAVVLYADNLPPNFFDVSSQQAGAILQKLRNYGVRLAVVAPAGSVVASSRFAELAAAEQRDRTFAVFPTREAALAWLRD